MALGTALVVIIVVSIVCKCVKKCKMLDYKMNKPKK